MTRVLTFHLLDKARRRHRRNKSLPQLIPGSGKIFANGALKVELTAVTGEVFVYAFQPRSEWMAELVERRPAPNAKPRPAVTPGAELKHATDMMLDALACFERIAQPKPQASPDSAAD